MYLNFSHQKSLKKIKEKKFGVKIQHFFFFYRKLKNWWRYFVYKSHLGKNETASEYQRHLKRWEHDYQLEEIDRLHLFDEYIEMSMYFSSESDPFKLYFSSYSIWFRNHICGGISVSSIIGVNQQCI